MAESMEYRYLGRSGLKVSVLSYGNMTTGMGLFTGKKDVYDIAMENHHQELMEKCISLGINFFDTAEIYGTGLSEVYLGNNIKRGNWDRDDLIITTKFNPRSGGIQGNSRKRLRQGINQSLKRLQLDNVDIAYLHRPDKDVPLKEQISALNEMIENDQAYYWGTSEFSAESLSEIFGICEKYGFIEPIVEQCEYNMLSRKRFEVEYAPIFDQYKLGTTTWSPLYGGMLSGKYNDGKIPSDSRFGQNSWDLEKSTEFLQGLGQVASDLGCTQAQLAIAWILKSPDVSTVLFGATSVSQVENNVGAIKVVEKLDQGVLEKIEKLLDNNPAPAMNWRTFTPKAHRR